MSGALNFNPWEVEALPASTPKRPAQPKPSLGGLGANPTPADPIEVIERAAIQAEAMLVRRLRPRAAGQGQPQPGDYCGCCKGSLWWTETDAEMPKGWRCCCCHPPAHLAPGQFRAMAT